MNLSEDILFYAFRYALGRMTYAVNGPVASPKYRLPMEPALAVLTGAGWLALSRRRSGEELRVQVGAA